MRLVVLAVVLLATPKYARAQVIAGDECAPYGVTHLAGHPNAVLERTLRAHHLQRIVLDELAVEPEDQLVSPAGSDLQRAVKRGNRDVTVVVMSEVGCLSADDIFGIDADHVVHRIDGPTFVYWVKGRPRTEVVVDRLRPHAWMCRTPSGDRRCAVGRASKIRLFALPEGARYGGSVRVDQ
jgi:hypothetical protein